MSCNSAWIPDELISICDVGKPGNRFHRIRLNKAIPSSWLCSSVKHKKLVSLFYKSHSQTRDALIDFNLNLHLHNLYKRCVRGEVEGRCLVAKHDFP